MSGIKHDNQKPDMSLLSPYALEAIAAVMTAGKTKYGADNWRGGLAFSRLYAAVMRHLTAYNRGELKDPETGLSHLAHASCGLAMMLEFEVTKPHLNDLYHCQPASNVAPKEEQLSFDFSPTPSIRTFPPLGATKIDNEFGTDVAVYKREQK